MKLLGLLHRRSSQDVMFAESLHGILLQMNTAGLGTADLVVLVDRPDFTTSVVRRILENKMDTVSPTTDKVIWLRYQAVFPLIKLRWTPADFRRVLFGPLLKNGSSIVERIRQTDPAEYGEIQRLIRRHSHIL